MSWVRESKDGNGVITFYPPEPEDKKTLPQCSYCGSRVQFLYFWPEILPYLKDDDIVPSFCDGNCVMLFLKQIRKAV